jgi:hypothetical protein
VRTGPRRHQGRPAREMFESSVFDVWTGSAEFVPLIDYVERTRATSSPLELTGFDLQLSGRLSKDRLVPELSRALPDSVAARRVLGVVTTMTTSMSRFAKVARPDRDAFFAAATELQALLELAPIPTAASWRRCCGAWCATRDSGGRPNSGSPGNDTPAGRSSCGPRYPTRRETGNRSGLPSMTPAWCRWATIRGRRWAARPTSSRSRRREAGSDRGAAWTRCWPPRD